MSRCPDRFLGARSTSKLAILLVALLAASTDAKGSSDCIVKSTWPDGTEIERCAQHSARCTDIIFVKAQSPPVSLACDPCAQGVHCGGRGQGDQVAREQKDGWDIRGIFVDEGHALELEQLARGHLPRRWLLPGARGELRAAGQSAVQVVYGRRSHLRQVCAREWCARVRDARRARVCVLCVCGGAPWL